MDPVPQVQIRVDLQGQPTHIRIQGDLTRDDRARLEQIIEADLGIPKEDQQWISAATSGPRQTP
jgi:hypothetical protein